ncbi:MAG: polysaccharide pyruvyl transferase family protein [Candidatus Krumholzibacteriota bacterium]|nr:polysaccharide pyruvyl transferase family protein [Candidatus Krumholzibacteriota bacterium]
MRITIHGSYGTGNRGDSVILAQMLRFLGDQLPGAEVTVLCRDERRLAILFETELPDSPLRLRPLHASFRRRPIRVLRACLACDLFILGGGGLLWGRAPGNLSYWLQRARLAKRAGRRLIFYVPGIYSIRGQLALQLLARTAEKADWLSVRDEEGRQQLLAAGVPDGRIVLGADPAFLLPPPQSAQIESLREVLGLQGQRLVGLSARDWRSRLSAGIFAKFVHNLLADEDTTLLFFALKTGGYWGETDTDDLTVANSLLRTLPAELQERVLVLDDRYSNAEMIALMGACRYLIGMRLHALIFATIAGIPFGAVAYDEKITAYMDMVGRREYLLDLSEVTDPDRIQTIVERLEAERAAVCDTGPCDSILDTAGRLSTRCLLMHEELAARLRSWFPEAAASGRVRD